MASNRTAPNERALAPAKLCLIAAAVLAVITPRAVPLLVWNTTPSAPVGLYRLSPFARVDRDALVLAMPPIQAQTLAAARGYLPAGVPLVKHVAALSGDKICAAGRVITINGRPVALRLSTDSRHRSLPHWRGCRTLARDDVFLLSARVMDSFDGRYFGPIRRSAVIGRVVPLWTF